MLSDAPLAARGGGGGGAKALRNWSDTIHAGMLSSSKAARDQRACSHGKPLVFLDTHSLQAAQSDDMAIGVTIADFYGP